MGKRILVQRKGRGGRQFRALSNHSRGAVKYAYLQKTEPETVIKGVITDIIHDPGRGAPVAYAKLETGGECLMLISEGMGVGDTFEIGTGAELRIGNIMPLKNIPEGTPVFNIEGIPFDGGKYVRSSGAYATVVSADENKAIVKMPSGVLKTFNSNCRATIGIVAGGGRIEKPFAKAGKKFYLMKAKGIHWPVVRGAAMSAVSHPHGGGSHQGPGGPSSVKRNTPPGAKVGLIAPKRTGLKKR
ncbi:MAG: 50S ribosomal protein L2 [Candidatus Odinarchaeota archaeon]